MFRDVRARKPLSAAQMQAAGEALDDAQFAWQSQGDNPPTVGHGGGIAVGDEADWFFGRITVKTRTSIIAAWQYGFIEQTLKPDGTFEEASEPRKVDGTHNWAYTKSGVDLSVGDFAVIRRSSYNPDLFEILFAVGGGTLTVCGSAIAPPLVTGDVCPPCGTLDVSTYTDIQGIYFEPCDFQVSATNLCGGTAGSGSGSSGSAATRAVRVQLTGKTETVDIPYRLVFCPDTCSVLVQYQYECFRRGLYIGRWFDPPVDCGSGSGSESGVV